MAPSAAQAARNRENGNPYILLRIDVIPFAAPDAALR